MVVESDTRRKGADSVWQQAWWEGSAAIIACSCYKGHKMRRPCADDAFPSNDHMKRLVDDEAEVHARTS